MNSQRNILAQYYIGFPYFLQTLFGNFHVFKTKYPKDQVYSDLLSVATPE